MPTLNKKSRLVRSPLLNEVEAESPKRTQATKYHSTINPEKFDMTRFSEMKDAEESSLRTIIYVVVVIVLGVAAALGVKYFLLDKQEDNDPADTEVEDTTDEIEEVSAFDINTVAALDSEAVSKPALEDYVDSELVTVGDATANVAGVSIDTMSYRRFTTFGRLSMNALGVVDANSFPQANVSYSSTFNQLTVTFNSVVTVNTELQESVTVGDIIEQVSFNTATNSFIITFSEPSKYSVQTSGNSLLIDVKTIDQLEIDMALPEEEVVVEEPVVTTPPTTTTGTNYTNEFSQSKQLITGVVTDNSVAHDIFYYADTVNFFEFAWGVKNKVGDQYIPNASAELVSTGGKFYIDITINNLSQEVFAQYGITGTNLSSADVDLTHANFVRIDRVSFENGTAKYRLELKNKADFKLLAEKTLDGSTQVIGLQIKD